jgi:hypothetical protein
MPESLTELEQQRAKRATVLRQLTELRIFAPALEPYQGF